MPPPNMIGVVSDMRGRYPAVWAKAHADYGSQGAPGKTTKEQAELFIRLLAYELYGKHGQSWGLNGKRGTSELSQDALNFREGNLRHVIDCIASAGTPSASPAWSVYAPHGDDKGRWIQPVAISQDEIDRIMGSETGTTPPPTKPPTEPPPPSFDFNKKPWPKFEDWPPSDDWCSVCGNNILAIAQTLKKDPDLEDIGEATFHAIRTMGDKNTVIEWSLKNEVKQGYPPDKPVRQFPFSEGQIKQFVERSSQLIREWRPWVIPGRIERQGGKWVMVGGDLAMKSSLPSFGNFLEQFLKGKSEGEVVAWIKAYPRHQEYLLWEQGKHPVQEQQGI